jgi:hypothetical protein
MALLAALMLATTIASVAAALVINLQAVLLGQRAYS